MKRHSKILSLGLFLLAGVGGLLNASELVVLPIDRAKFLAGAKFDLLVECRECGSKVDVKIGGQDAQQFFKKPARLYEEGGVSYYRIDSVSFDKTGPLKLEAKAGKESKTLSYEVVAPKLGKNQKMAKNVILFIGDGMSLQAKQMARILSKGINEGKYNGLLEMEKLDRLALVTTSGYDSLTTDSANSASAYATGHKSVVNAMGVYADSTADPLDDPKVENLAELLRRTKGMSLGLVTTSNITDATPAAMFAHTRRRAEQAHIAMDMLRVKPEVILGGGLIHFWPKEQKGSKRSDSKDLLKIYKDAGYALSFDREDLDALMKKSPKYLLGLYHPDHMDVYLDREVLKASDVLGEYPKQPNLMDMTKAALEILSKNQKGFFLMVEGASIDKQLHKMDWQRATYDTIEMDKAVGVAREFADKNGETLIIVVADHAHSASITGTYHENDGKKGREAVRTYESSIFPTFEDADADGFPDNPDPDITLAIQYANHPDYKANYRLKSKPSHPTIKDADGRNIANPSLEGEDYKGNIPYAEDQEVHAADDIVLMAHGAGSDYFRGVMDNTEVFFGIVRALGVDGRLGDYKRR